MGQTVFHRLTQGGEGQHWQAIRVCVLVQSDILHPEAATTKNLTRTQETIRNSSNQMLHNWVIELLTTPPSDVPAMD